MAEPLFIIAPPRSGSTFLFESLRRLAGILALKQEADHIWWELFPYCPPSPSDFVGASEATPATTGYFRQRLILGALRVYLRESNTPWQRFFSFMLCPHSHRYLDKTISNCFHLGFLEQAWPDAHYIFLVRDPRANISSMMESWSYQNIVEKPQLTSFIPSDATISHWSFPAPPGWYKYVHKPLEELCAWSWQQHVKYALQFLEQHPRRVVHVRYEELVDTPVETLCKLAEELDIPVTNSALEYASERPNSRTTISSPMREKWTYLHYEEIMAILPLIKKTAQDIGYLL